MTMDYEFDKKTAQTFFDRPMKINCHNLANKNELSRRR